MKRRLIVLFGLGLLLMWSVVAYAFPVPFSNTVDFSGSLVTSGSNTGSPYFDGRDFVRVNDSYNYSHNVTFDPPAISITYAQIVLSHQNNLNNANEIWFLYEGTSTSIGRLSTSIGDHWVDQLFVLDSSLYSAISGGFWSLALSLQESTSGEDNMKIDKSVLSGTYSAVPEPTTMLLFGLGLLGLAGVRRKLKK